MSELLFTQAEFDNYIDTIDKTNAANIKALSSIQILAPRLFNDLMYLLITGRVTLTQLTGMSINNSTIQNLVDIIFSTPITIAEKSIFYREMLLSLTGLNTFMAGIS